MGRSRRALITGAGGFVGGHLARLLDEKGLEVWAGYRRHRKKFPFPLRWRKADLTLPDAAFDLVRWSRPDVIFHLAGQAVPALSWENPEETFAENTAAAIHLLEAARRWAPKARVVLASSSHVYGRSFSTKKRVGEEDLADPVSPYGASKFLMELAGLNYCRQNGMDVVIVRAFNLVGTGQNPNYVFANFCRQVVQMERGKKTPVLSVGNIGVVRDFIHVRDGARGYLLLAQKGKRGGIYNLGSGKGMRLRKAVPFLRRESGIPFRVVSETSRFRKDELPRVVSDSSRAGRLGWRPRESVWTGIREILQEYREKSRS